MASLEELAVRVASSGRTRKLIDEFIVIPFIVMVAGDIYYLCILLLFCLVDFETVHDLLPDLALKVGRFQTIQL